jgi:hypothetical protein
MTWLDHPGLTRQQFTNPTHLAWKRDPAIIVLHSTEGAGYPSAATYRQGRSAPHLTVDPRGRTARQHYPLSEAAWALVAPSGVSTNTGGAVQVEIIGTCDPRNAKLPSVLTFDDGDLQYLASILRAIHYATGIPLTSAVSWLAYPASYGASGARLSADAWRAYRGVLGHQHVPGNSHGDPGTLNVSRLLELAGGASSSPVPPAADTRPRNADGSLRIAIDDARGPATIARWQEVMSTPIDGALSKPSTVVRADQAFLNAAVPAANIRDLTGAPALDVDGREGPKTIKVRQFWLFNRQAATVLGRAPQVSDFDGVAGSITTRLHQHALNAATARSGRY